MFFRGEKLGVILDQTTANDNGRITGNYLAINTEGALNFFQKLSLVQGNLLDNSFGLFSYMSVGNKEKVRFAQLSQPSNVLQKCTEGCTWNPKGRINMTTDYITLCCVEFMSEQCGEAIKGCLSEIFGTGNDMGNLWATPEGRALWAEIMSIIYVAIGNSLWTLAWWGQHPLIKESAENDWYQLSEDSGLDDKEWADYVDNQEVCGGYITMMDYYKDQGVPNYGVEFLPEEIGTDENNDPKFIGVASKLFDRMLKARKPIMRRMSKKYGNSQDRCKEVFKVDPSIFEAYENELMEKYDQLQTSFQYFYNGKFCEAVGCSGEMAVEGVLKYKGHWIVCCEDFQDFNNTVGVKGLRAILITPYTLGLPFDVPNLEDVTSTSSTGETVSMPTGLIVEQDMNLRAKKRIDMHSKFRIGFGILDPDLIVMACIVYKPTA